MTRGKAEDAGGLTPAKDDNAAPYHFDRRTLPIFKCVDYISQKSGAAAFLTCGEGSGVCAVPLSDGICDSYGFQACRSTGWKPFFASTHASRKPQEPARAAAWGKAWTMVSARWLSLVIHTRPPFCRMASRRKGAG